MSYHEKYRLKTHMEKWLIANMNDGDSNLATCKFVNYTLEDMFNDVCEAIDDYEEADGQNSAT